MKALTVCTLPVLCFGLSPLPWLIFMLLLLLYVLWSKYTNLQAMWSSLPILFCQPLQLQAYFEVLTSEQWRVLSCSCDQNKEPRDLTLTMVPADGIPVAPSPCWRWGPRPEFYPAVWSSALTHQRKERTGTSLSTDHHGRHVEFSCLWMWQGLWR